MDKSMRKKEVGLEILDRKPPFNLEAEMGVLGSLMLQPELVDDVSLMLKAEDFYDDSHRKLYDVMVEFHNEGKRLDVMLIAEKLRTMKLLDAIGGSAFLAKVFQSVPNSAHAVYYATIVRDKSTLRSLITTSTQILQRAYDESWEAKDIAAMAETKIMSVIDRTIKKDLIKPLDLFTDALNQLELRLEGKSESGVKTGYSDLDRLLVGLSPGNLIILAARPSMGKTAFAMNIVENIVNDGGECVVFSLEMNAFELTDRLLCSIAKVNGIRMREGTINIDDRKRIVEAAGEWSKKPLYVNDSAEITVAEIAAHVRRRARKNKISLVVIDYLQLIQAPNPRDPRQEQVAQISRALKALAKEQQVPVLVLSQLNRQTDEGQDKRPRLSHLRESGAIEQDADVVMFVHREEYYRKNDDEVKGKAEIIVEKQRLGPLGTVPLLWRKEFCRFETVAEERFEAEAPPTNPTENQGSFF